MFVLLCSHDWLTFSMVKQNSLHCNARLEQWVSNRELISTSTYGKSPINKVYKQFEVLLQFAQWGLFCLAQHSIRTCSRFNLHRFYIMRYGGVQLNPVFSLGMIRVCFRAVLHWKWLHPSNWTSPIQLIPIGIELLLIGITTRFSDN